MGVSYTIRQVDEAMVAIIGIHGVRPGDHGWNRTTAMLQAAAQAFISQRPSDNHSEVLRSALLDLNTRGYMLPADGKWPEDDQ